MLPARIQPRGRLARGGFLLICLLLLTLWGVDRAVWGQPYIRVFNRSGLPLQKVVIGASEGGEHSFAVLEDKHRVGVKLKVQGEASVTLSFQAAGQTHTAGSAYVESEGGYCIDYVVTPTLQVKTNLNIVCFRLERILP
uniref:Uncharacterized protein n=1 Tax=Cyanothece sp. (strain PCC 7425 / ATCC 29141) TaxID=395961 RepID=B8HVC8_CYAP4